METVKRSEIVNGVCLLELTAEVMEVLKLPAGSFVMLERVNDEIKAELIPPPTEELMKEFDDAYEYLKSTFAEM